MPVVKLSARTTPVSWDAVLEEFILTKQAEGRAERTVKDYRYHLGVFFTNHGAAWPDYHRLKVEVRKHFAALAAASATTYNLRRCNLKAFFNWCVEEGYLPANPAAGVPKRKDVEQIRHVGEEDIVKLLEVIDRRTYSGLRDYALVLTQLDTAARPGELLALPPSCFNLVQREIYIPAAVAKTRQARVVVFSPTTAKAIKNCWLPARRNGATAYLYLPARTGRE